MGDTFPEAGDFEDKGIPPFLFPLEGIIRPARAHAITPHPRLSNLFSLIYTTYIVTIIAIKFTASFLSPIFFNFPGRNNFRKYKR